MASSETPRLPSARGRQRRDVLVAAAAQVLMDTGFGGVTHRAVAQRAALPLAATTYYFSSLEDLLDEAMQHLASSWLTAAHEVLDAAPTRLRSARAVADTVLRVVAAGHDLGDADQAALLTLYERYLEAGRHPRLRPLVARYDAQLDAMVAEVLRRGRRPATPEAVRLVLAVADGAVLRGLAEGADAVKAARGSVERLMHALGGG